MGAARMVVTVAVLGIAAGTLLASTVLPAFSPYRDSSRDRREDQPRVVQAAPIDGAAYELASPPEPDGIRIELGPREGTFVVQLPSWAQEPAEWVAFGQRAAREWQAWSGTLRDTAERWEGGPKDAPLEFAPPPMDAWSDHQPGQQPGYAPPRREPQPAESAILPELRDVAAEAVARAQQAADDVWAEQQAQ